MAEQSWSAGEETGSGSAARITLERALQVGEVLLLVLGTFALRPAALGQGYTSWGLVLFSLGAWIHGATRMSSPHRDYALRFSKQNSAVLMAGLFLWAFLLVHAGLMSSKHMDFVVEATVANGLIIFLGAWVLSEPRTRKMYFRGLVLVILASIGSYVITFIMRTFVPLERLYFFQIQIKGYRGNGSFVYPGTTFFPFTVLYGFYSSGSIHLPRLLGPFTEPGIFQAFIIWAYFSLKSLRLNHWIAKLLLICGLIGTFSTAGIILFPLAAAFHLLVSGKPSRRLLWHYPGRIVLMFMIGTVVALLAFYVPYVGIRDKSHINNESLSTRLDDAQRGLSTLISDPLGVGLYNLDGQNVGINLLGEVQMIGIIGLVLVLLVYALPGFYAPNRRAYFTSILPLFLTFLIAQPLLDAPVMYLMLMSNPDS